MMSPGVGSGHLSFEKLELPPAVLQGNTQQSVQGQLRQGLENLKGSGDGWVGLGEL